MLGSSRPASAALALALLALLTSPAPLALAKALPEEAATRTEASGALYVYRDGSAVLALRVAGRLEPMPLRLSLNASLEVDELAPSLNASLEACALLAPSPGETPTYPFEASRTEVQAELSDATAISLESGVRVGASEASLSLSVVDERTAGPRAAWRGLLRLRAAGDFTVLLEAIDVADEELLKELVASLFRSCLTDWGGAISSVEVLNATKAEREGGRELAVDFGMLIDKEEVTERLGRLLGLKTAATLFDEVFSPPSAPFSITFYVGVSQNSTACRVRASLRAPPEDFFRAALFACIVDDVFGRHYFPPPFYAADVRSLLFALTALAKDFSVVKGGRLCLSLEEAQGATPPATLLTMTLATPRVAKKDAKAPADTLKALSNASAALCAALPPFLMDALGEALRNATLSVLPEEGVKVRLGDTEVREVAFKDVGSLKVTFATAIALSAEPRVHDAGGEVVVRGRLEPPMTVPITIIIREPDGSAKTIEVTTSEDGSFSVSIELEKAGPYVISTSYAGGDLYEPSTAEVIVEAKAPSFGVRLLMSEALWYAVIVATIVGAVVAIAKAPWSAGRP